MIRSLVFKIPDRDQQALVTIFDDGRVSLAFRPGYGSWGPPIAPADEQRDAGWREDLDAGPRPIPDYMRGRG